MTEPTDIASSTRPGTQADAEPTDIYGTPWGEVLERVDPDVLATTGAPTIEIPDGIPGIE